MKNLLHTGLLFIIAAMFLSGCYTQVAMRDYDRERYEEDYADESEYYDENDSTYYEEDADYDVNIYYGYSPYRRYFWGGYYPGITIGIGWNTYYDPFYWDPFYYNNYWCLPYYWSYNPFYHFHDYSYYYGYGYNYGNNWGYSPSITKERTNDRLRLRNSGDRNPGNSRSALVTRDNGTSKNRSSLTKNSRDGSRVTSRERAINKDGGSTVRKRNEETSKSTLRRNSSDNTSRIKRNTQKEERKYTSPRNDGRKETIKKDSRGSRKESIRKDTGRSNRSGSYSTPRTSSTPRSTYSSPRSSGGSSRGTTSGGGSSRSSGSGSSSGGSRSSGGGNRR